MFSRLFLVAFLVAAGLMRSFAQTTVTLPTIPCSTCNGPGSFATTAPACTPASTGAPLTMSWGTAQGATTYTIMIATDAALSQNVAAHTQTGTTLSVPAYALKPNTTYYWTVFANSAAGSTKASSGVCSFITNATWTGSSTTGSFPFGSLSDRQFAQGLAGGYYSCQTGDGTCASGDNLICNSKFDILTQGDLYVPNWSYFIGATGQLAANIYYDLGVGIDVLTNSGGSVNLAAASGIGAPPSGTQRGVKFGRYTANNAWINYTLTQNMLIQNATQGTYSYQVSFYAKNSGGGNLTASFHEAGGRTVSSVTATLSTNWTKFNLTLNVPSLKIVHGFLLESDITGLQYVTDVTLCKL